jgi:hypothetical protein
MKIAPKPSAANKIPDMSGKALKTETKKLRTSANPFAKLFRSAHAMSNLWVCQLYSRVLGIIPPSKAAICFGAALVAGLSLASPDAPLYIHWRGQKR